MIIVVLLSVVASANRVYQRTPESNMLGRVFLFVNEMKSPMGKRIYKRDKGLPLVTKIKSVLRKIFVNGTDMRKASVLKQNKYRKK